MTDLVEDQSRPITVTVKTGRKLIGIGNTTMFKLIKAGRLKTVKIGRRRLVVYDSLLSLAHPEAQAEARDDR